jgi:ribose transport system ATP-binding protein
MPENVLQFEGISKSFFGVHALRGVTFGLPAGHVLGLIGENGAGKSTLMNILGGVLPPDSGRMTVRATHASPLREYAPRNPAEATRAGVAFIHQELNLFTNLSIVDNLFIDRFPTLGRSPFINRRAARERAKQLLETLSLDLAPETTIDRLTPGERQLVEIAKALSTGAEIILFDEPTTSLTAGETQRLFGIIRDLRAQGKSMIYISHNLGNVLDLADDIVVLRDGQVVDTGPRAEFTVDRMIARMVGREIDQIFPTRASKPSEEILLEVQGLSQPGLVKDIDLVLHQGEVLGLFGLMGSGRTELARILFGLEPFERGRIAIQGVPRARVSAGDSIRQGLAFVTENRREEGLLMEATILDNVALVSLPAFAGSGRDRTARESEIRSNTDAGGGRSVRTHFGSSLLPRLLRQRRLREAVTRVAQSLRIKSGPVDRTLAKNLSGGNQQKAVIGKWLLSRPTVFIMDEPTRGVDVGAKYEVYSIINDLAARGAGILLISSELEELTGMCDRILVMSKGEIQGTFARGDFAPEPILHAAFRGHQAHRGGSK